MAPDYRRVAIAAAAGLAMLGALAALPEGSVLRNTSLSMPLGWYARVPFAEPVAGSIVAFPVPAQARDLADKAGIRGSLLKRVLYRHGNGDLYLAGDCGGARSFDSRHYGAVPETSIIGVYKLVVERNPSREKGTQDKRFAWGGAPCKAGSAKDFKDLASSTWTLPAGRVDESPMRVTAKW